MNNFDKFSNALRERSAEEVLCNVLQQDEEKRRKRCSLVDVRPGCTRKDTHERCSRSLQPFLLNSPIVAIIKKIFIEDCFQKIHSKILQKIRQKIHLKIRRLLNEEIFQILILKLKPQTSLKENDSPALVRFYKAFTMTVCERRFLEQFSLKTFHYKPFTEIAFQFDHFSKLLGDHRIEKFDLNCSFS